MIATLVCNQIKAEAEQVSLTGFPLHVLPQSVQEIVLDMFVRSNYVIEFVASGMLSAISAALGNACTINIRENWDSNSVMYMVFVGIPGFGKSPALQAAYRPIQEHDEALMEQFNREMDAYENAKAASKGEGGCDMEKPVLKCFIVNDFTPEAMLEIHSHNLRGIVIKVDELIGMFRSATRYSSGSQLIEQLLSAWSGNPISIQRKNLPRPIRIDRPCINIIGTMQPAVVPDIFKQFDGNGMLDRLIFVYPMNRELRHWSLVDSELPHTNPHGKWKAIVDKVFSIEDNCGKGEPIAIGFDEKATQCFINWRNSVIDYANEHRNDGTLDSRWSKRNIVVARLSLVLQVMKWACDEGALEHIDADSVKGAIALSDYYEHCYRRLLEDMAEMNTNEEESDMLSALGDEFTTHEAKAWGKNSGVCERTVMSRLADMKKNNIIRKIGHGKYAIIKADKPDNTASIIVSPPSPSCID